MYLWDAKGSELYMRPLIQQLCEKGIPLTTKPLGFQCSDGWTCGYQSLRGGLKRSARVVRLFGHLAVLETHTWMHAGCCELAVRGLFAAWGEVRRVTCTQFAPPERAHLHTKGFCGA